MADGQRREQLGAAGRLAAAAACLFVFTAREVRPDAWQVANGLVSWPTWSPTRQAWLDALATPGGLAGWLAGWLGRFWHWPPLAALIVTTLAVALALVLDGLLTRLAGRRRPGWRYLPLWLVMVLAGRYSLRLDLLLGLLAALVLARGYVALGERPPGFRAAVLVSAAAGLYHLAGPALVTLVALAAVIEFRRPGGRLLGLVYLVWLELVPWLFLRLVQDRPPLATYAALLPDGQGLGRALALALSLICVLAVAWPPRRSGRPAPGWLTATAVLLVSWGGGQISLDRATREMITINRDLLAERWSSVLAGVRRVPPTYWTSYAGICALQATGRLGDELFSLSQSPYSLMVRVDRRTMGQQDPTRMRVSAYHQLGDLWFRLGLLNDAEREEHEALETYGDASGTLLRLARINAVKDNPAAAAVFLRVAARDPVDGPEARRLLAELAADPTLSADPAVALARANRLRTDADEQPFSLELRLRQAVESNPRNRAAVDLLQASYLLDNRPDLVAANIRLLDTFGQPTIPRHWEEALLIHEALSGEAVDLAGRTVRPETRARFRRFLALLGCDADELAAKLAQPLPVETHRAVAAELAGTYFNYCLWCRGVGLL